jgi:hypothetical protein
MRCALVAVVCPPHRKKKSVGNATQRAAHETSLQPLRLPRITVTEAFGNVNRVCSFAGTSERTGGPSGSGAAIAAVPAPTVLLATETDYRHLSQKRLRRLVVGSSNGDPYPMRGRFAPTVKARTDADRVMNLRRESMRESLYSPTANF